SRRERAEGGPIEAGAFGANLLLRGAQRLGERGRDPGLRREGGIERSGEGARQVIADRARGRDDDARAREEERLREPQPFGRARGRTRRFARRKDDARRSAREREDIADRPSRAAGERERAVPTFAA